MPTIIDSLLVELGFDTKRLPKDQKEMVDALNKMEEGQDRAAKNMEVSGKKMGQAIYSVRNQVVTLMAAFTAGSGLKTFFQQMTTTDTAAGRLAKNIGMTVDQLTAWQGVAARSGGTAEGITGTMQGLTAQFQELALTGQSSVIPYFRAVGVAIADVTTGKMRPLNDVLLDLSDKFSKMDPAQAQALGRGMGVDEGTVNVLLKGRDAVTALLAEQEKLGHANKEDAKAAIERQQALVALKQVSEDLGRKFLTVLTPAIIWATNALIKLGEWFRQHPKEANIAIGTMTAAVAALSIALGVGAVAAFASFTAAGVASFVALLAAAAPFLLAMAPFIAGGLLVAGAGYGLFKGAEWLKERQGFADKDFTKPGAWGKAVPRGIRNNNPGNLEFAGQDGASREPGSGRFALFKTMQDGIAALAEQLKRYAARGIDTINKIISKYAPPNENNTKAYIDAIAKRLGVDPNARLNLQDQSQLRGLIDGISTIENGKGQLSLQQINAALDARNNSGSGARSVSSQMHIETVNVNTQATDASGIARGFGQAVDKYHNMAAMANYGLE